VARRRRAVLLAAEAQTLAAKDPARALSLSEEAVRLSPGLTPAAVLTGKLLGQDGKVWRAQAIIENAWAQAPHPELAAVYATLKADETPRARAARLQGLAERSREAVESRILAAQQWAALKDFAQARAALGDLPEQFPSARIAALMAEIAQGAGAPGEARYWLERAVRAPRDPQWVCESCHGPAPAWTPVCPSCDGFDTLSWRASAHKITALEALPERPALEAALPSSMPSSMPSSGPVLAPGTAPHSTALIVSSEASFAPLAPSPATTPAPHGAAPAGPPIDTTLPMPPPQRPTLVPKRPEPPAGTPHIFVSPRAPDDPGSDDETAAEGGSPARVPEHRW